MLLLVYGAVYHVNVANELLDGKCDLLRVFGRCGFGFWIGELWVLAKISAAMFHFVSAAVRRSSGTSSSEAI